MDTREIIKIVKMVMDVYKKGGDVQEEMRVLVLHFVDLFELFGFCYGQDEWIWKIINLARLLMIRNYWFILFQYLFFYYLYS